MYRPPGWRSGARPRLRGGPRDCAGRCRRAQTRRARPRQHRTRPPGRCQRRRCQRRRGERRVAAVVADRQPQQPGIGGHLERAIAGAAVLEYVRDRLPDHGNQDGGRLGRRVRAYAHADVDARRRQDVAGRRELRIKRQVPGLAGHQAHIGAGGGGDPRELGDLLTRPGIVAADELADQVSLHRDRGQAKAEEVMGVPRHAQPLAGHRLAGQFATQVFQSHGQPREPGQPVHQQAECRALHGQEQHPAQRLQCCRHWRRLHRPQDGNAGDHRDERDQAGHAGDEQQRGPGEEPAHGHRMPAGYRNQGVREDGLQEEGDGPAARPGNTT